MDTHLTPAFVSAPSADAAGRHAAVKARAAARQPAPLASAAARAGTDGRYTLARGEVVSLQGRPGQAVEVLSGRLWLTQTGDTGDHFVDAGQTHTLRALGRLVIEGDSAAPAQWRWQR